MFEFDPTVDLGDLVTTRLHPAGVRSFTYEDSALATTDSLEALFHSGFDVVSANAGASVVEARIRVNQRRGVVPP